MEACSCGVPRMVSKLLHWEPNGVITIGGTPNRMVFLESGNLDVLFASIEDLVGIPVKHIVIESRARETKRFIERMYPPEVREKVARLSNADGGLTTEEYTQLLAENRSINQSILDISRVYGYGDQRQSDLWDSGGAFPWRTQIMRNPYCLLFVVADNLGGVEACEGRSHVASYEKIGDDTYMMVATPGEHPAGLAQRLKRRFYDYKPGDIVYERCSDCGVPLVVADKKWDLEEGTIIDPYTGRRMAIFGPAAVDAVFEDLESELGPDIPNVIIEAVRRDARDLASSDPDRWNRPGNTFRNLIALRGFGNLRSFDGDENHLSLHIENACIPLIMVGIARGLVELTYGVDSSRCEWNFADDGDLDIDVIVR